MTKAELETLVAAMAAKLDALTEPKAPGKTKADTKAKPEGLRERLVNGCLIVSGPIPWIGKGHPRVAISFPAKPEPSLVAPLKADGFWLKAHGGKLFWHQSTEKSPKAMDLALAAAKAFKPAPATK